MQKLLGGAEAARPLIVALAADGCKDLIGRILRTDAFRFHSRDLHLVLGATKNGEPLRFKVKLDGTAPGDNRSIRSVLSRFSDASATSRMWVGRLSSPACLPPSNLKPNVVAITT
jgi:hypothetical protein